MMIIVVSCSQQDTPDATNEIVARTASGGSLVDVLPLDHPDNPYKGQYGVWDQWRYDNIVLDPALLVEDGKPEDWKVYSVYVSEDGFMLPFLTRTEMRWQAAEQGEVAVDFSSFPYRAQGAGVEPTEVKLARDEAFGQLASKYYGYVPDWLASDPPMRAMLLPDGQIVTHGLLGSANDPEAQDAADCCGGEDGLPYCLYDASGVLQATCKGSWVYLFLNSNDERTHGGKKEFLVDGTVVVRDYETGEPLRAFTYKGEEIDPAVAVSQRSNLLNFTMLDPDMLTVINRYGGEN
jgi:hypothetical protein